MSRGLETGVRTRARRGPLNHAREPARGEVPRLHGRQGPSNLVEFARQDGLRRGRVRTPEEDTSRAALAVAAAFADESSSEEEEAQEESFASVAADADARFEPLEVLVLSEARPHACAPTYTLSANSKSGPLTLLEKRVAPGPATLSRVDTVLEREDRLEWLKMKGLDCDCARCRFENGESVSSTLLRAVAACAERDGRFEDALRAHGAILEEDPSDGDALYGRARVHGWSDKWGVERRLLEEAIALAPDHPDIRKAVATRDAYHCRGLFISNVWI